MRQQRRCLCSGMSCLTLRICESFLELGPFAPAVMGPTGDDRVDEAFAFTEDTLAFLTDVTGSDSIDGNGAPVISSVHFGTKVGNAFWNGTQMLYGDGDDEIFHPLTKSRSVIGHELAHGVVQFAGGLKYENESGALNESFADVMGALVEQFSSNTAARDADWLIGDGLIIGGGAIRSMAEPGSAYRNHPLIGSDPQPAHMSEFKPLPIDDDHGGVHINSGIPNHAFYLLSMMIGGNAWDKPRRIWFETLRNIPKPIPTIRQWAEESVTSASTLFGGNTREHRLTRHVWKLVGVL